MKTVSAIIAALNEQDNITQFLESLLNQKGQEFTLTHVIVISDGSEDSTAKLARSFKDARITVIDSPSRIGKASHLNKYFKELDTDFITFFDADVVLDSPDTLQKLIYPMLSDESVMLVGGNGLPTKGRNFLEKAVNVSTEAYIRIRDEYKEGNNAFGAQGCIMALRKSFAKEVLIPPDTIANDNFLYFSCITRGYKFVHNNDAIVWYRSPTTLKDHFKQNSRFIAAHEVMANIFGEIARQEYAVPKRIIVKHLLLTFMRHPVYSSAIFILNRYTALLARKRFKDFNAKWEMAPTTKVKIDKA